MTAASLTEAQRQALSRVVGEPDPLLHGLRVYVVGGAVRDALLGMQAGDRDWVVVGARPEDLAERGFLPVGGDFPVFLHPRTREEFALARTERKSGRGYKGFTFYTGVEVCLEDDLQRRDLTINAMAMDSAGRLHDPLDGLADLQERRLRHVGQAFCEDPVRLLRLARFAARLPDFTVADDTLELARRLVRDGEVDALVPERVWQEFAKGLMAPMPGRMFEVLAEAGALPRIAPGLAYNALIGQQLREAAQRGMPLAGRFAVLCQDTAQVEDLAQRLRAPSECRDQARLLQDVLSSPVVFEPYQDLDAALRLLEQTDALRRPERFQSLLQAAMLVLPVPSDQWTQLHAAMKAVDAGAVAARFKGRPDQIRAAVRSARLEAMQARVEFRS